MKIALPEYTVESSADFKSLAYGFGDPVILMEFLRNTLYSNPIATIVQEYMSNGRDAHRERGNPEQPLKITLPTKIDPHFYCRDFGLGISPNRMSEVFTQYGVSTKRSENKETGGFGLGCKSAYSYTDTFTVVTITEESDGCKTKRTWVSILDESGLGAINLVSEEKTDEDTGTTIIIPVNPGDYHEFTRQVKRTASWWDIKPEITNHPEFVWDKYYPVFEGKDKDWVITNSNRHEGKFEAILDGIPYRLHLSSIYPNKSDDEDADYDPTNNPIPQYAIDLSSTDLKMFFNCGDLQVTLNREAIDYSPEGIELLQKRIKKAYEEILEHLEKELNEAKNLWEANIKWRSVKSKFGFIKNSSKWKGFSLSTVIRVPQDHRWDLPAKDRTKVYHYIRDEGKDGDENKPKLAASTNSRTQSYYSRDVNNIPCNNEALLVEDDTHYSVPPRTKIRTLFVENPDINDIYIVRIKSDKIRKNLEDEYHWSELEPIKLSQIKKTFYKPPNVITPKAIEVRICNYWNSWSPADVDLEKGKGVFVTKYKGKLILNDKEWRKTRDLHKQTFLTEDLFDLLNNYSFFKDLDIYAVLDRTVPKLGPGWISLYDHIKSELNKIKSDPEYADTLKYDDSYALSNSVYNIDIIDFDKLEPDNILKKYRDLSIKVKKYKYISALVNRIELEIGLPKTTFRTDNTLKTMWSEISKRYPLLLKTLNPYNQVTNEKQEMAKYIHLVDALNR